MRITREEARLNGVEMEEVPIDKGIKPVNIYIATTFSKDGRKLLAKELPLLRQYDIDFKLEMEPVSGESCLIMYIDIICFLLLIYISDISNICFLFFR